MSIDIMEVTSFKKLEELDLLEHKKTINEGCTSRRKAVNGVFQNIEASIDKNLQEFLDAEDLYATVCIHPTIMESTKQMIYGVEHNGFKTMGLNGLSKWKLDKSSQYYHQNLRQQAGYAAEIISTCKENMKARINHSEMTTYRADDLPELFGRNDPYVDKVRINKEGQIVERIQTKFVGKNGKDWVAKMMLKKSEKYLDGQHVDKLECPKNYYDEAKSTILEKKYSLEKQLERIRDDGKVDVINKIQKKIDKLGRIDEMIEKSNTTTKEAMYARLYPRSVAAKIFATETTKLSNMEGIKGGTFSAGITFVSSTVDNISSYAKGKITAEEMVENVIKKTALSGTAGYGTAFISTAVSEAMKTSSKQFIRCVGKSSLPSAAVSFAIESYDSVTEFAEGKISGSKLAYDLGENATLISGATAGAKIGTSVGGAPGMIIGGMIGCAVSSEMYATAVEVGVDNVENVAEKIQEYADATVNAVKSIVPDKIKIVKDAFNDFAYSSHIPLHV